MIIKDYQDAVSYLEGFIGKVIFNEDLKFIKLHPPLDRMKMLLKLLDNPQDKFKSVLVGGTSGKGSTAYLISHILTTAGYKTGLTISPHLQKINERIQINGQSISDEEFVKLLKTLILPSIREMSKMEIGAPSYFEILIAMAFLYFVQEKVDIAVVEVGMGGEFDATNTLSPLIAVLTNVSLDHTNILGNTVEKIARTKAGIIKMNKESRIMNQGGGHNSRFMIHDSIVVTGIKQKSVIKIIEQRCKKAGAQLFRLGKDFNFKIKKVSHKETVFDLTITRDRVQRLNDLRLSLLGDYQVVNASLAVETVLQLEKFGFSHFAKSGLASRDKKISEKNIRKALSTAFFPGRFEITKVHSRQKFIVHGIYHQPSTINHQLVLDGAHNPAKMKAFLSSLKKIYPKERKVFIVAFKNDKDIKSMLRQITKAADAIVITEFHTKTATEISACAPAESIMYYVSHLRQGFGGQASIKYGGKIIVEKDSEKALDIALNYPITQLPNYKPIIVVTGSLYLVGEIRSML